MYALTLQSRNHSRRLPRPIRYRGGLQGHSLWLNSQAMDTGISPRSLGPPICRQAIRVSTTTLDRTPLVADLQRSPKCPQPSPPNNTLDFGPYVPFPDCGEDEFKCLNLNVYSPVNVDRRLPVLFWIHGWVQTMTLETGRFGAELQWLSEFWSRFGPHLGWVLHLAL